MKIDVKYVAKLANLPLTSEEEKKFSKQLGETLDYVNRLEQIDTKNVEPTSQVTGLENVTREDEVTPSLPQEEVLKNAKSTYKRSLKTSFESKLTNSVYKGFIKVKAILSEDTYEY